MAEKKPALPGKDAKPKAEGGLIPTLIAFVLAGLIAGGGGAFMGLQNKPAPPDAPKSDAKAKLDESKETAPVIAMGALDLPPIVTNLAAPADVWVRVEATLIFEGKTLPHGEALVGQIAGDLLAFMRTQTLEQIQGVSGLQHLRQDLGERVAIRSEGKVKQLIIKSLVVQ
jgi:flagellar FliL protein